MVRYLQRLQPLVVGLWHVNCKHTVCEANDREIWWPKTPETNSSSTKLKIELLQNSDLQRGDFSLTYTPTTNKNLGNLWLRKRTPFQLCLQPLIHKRLAFWMPHLQIHFLDWMWLIFLKLVLTNGMTNLSLSLQTLIILCSLDWIKANGHYDMLNAWGDCTWASLLLWLNYSMLHLTWRTTRRVENCSC